MNHGARWIIAVTVVLAIGVACGPSLPSSEPLGSGPLAEPEPVREEHTATRADAGASEVDEADAGAREPVARDAEVDASPAQDTGEDTDASTTVGSDAADGSAEASVVDFEGEYRGSDISVIQMDGLPDRTERDPNARTRVEQPATDRIEITLINSANGDPLCTVEARVSGSRAEVHPDQSCFDEGSTLTGSVSSGHAQLDGDRLTLDLDVALELTIGTETRNGRIDYHFDGKR